MYILWSAAIPIDTTPDAQGIMQESGKTPFPPVENEADDPVVDTGPGIDDAPVPGVPPAMPPASPTVVPQPDDKPAEPPIRLPGQPGAPERV